MLPTVLPADCSTCIAENVRPSSERGKRSDINVLHTGSTTAIAAMKHTNAITCIVDDRNCSLATSAALSAVEAQSDA